MLLIVDSVAFPGRLHVIQGGENSPKARRVAATSRASRLCPCLGESGSAQACALGWCGPIRRHRSRSPYRDEWERNDPLLCPASPPRLWSQIMLLAAGSALNVATRVQNI